MKNKSGNLIIALLAVLIVLLGAVAAMLVYRYSEEEAPSVGDTALAVPSDTQPAETASVPAEEPKPEETEPPKPKFARLIMGGDVLIHDNMLVAGLADRDSKSDFSFLFKHTTDLFKKYDLAILNMEGTMGPPPFSAYPLFHSPTKLAQDMHAAGVEMAITSNNHCLDAHPQGVTDTLEALRHAGITPIGTSTAKDQPTWKVVDVKGILIGFSAYTYETARIDGVPSINGLLKPEELDGRVDSFSYEEPWYSKDIAAMQERAKQMREAGAQFVVFFMHWGTEYDTNPSSYQKEIAQKLADAGVDLILACGPHVIQPIETVKSEDGKHSCLVYYSVGNFVSAQYFDTGNSSGHAEDGLLAMVEIESEDGQAKLVRAGYMPFYCYKPSLHGGAASQAVPLEAGLAHPDWMNGHTDLLENSKARTEAIMSNNHVEGLPFGEVPIGLLPEESGN